MNDKYYVNFKGFDEYRKVFKEKTDEFQQELLSIYNAYLKVEWEGEGYESFKSSFNMQFDDLNYIPQILNLFSEFMEKALINYSDGMEEIKKSFDSLLQVIRDEKRKRGELFDED